MEEKEITVIQRYYEEVWTKGNLDVLDLSIGPNIVRHNPPFPDVCGIQEYKAYYERIRQALSNIHVQFDDVLILGDLSSARARMTCVHTGLLQGLQIPATGRKVTLEMGIFSHWAGGIIIEEWVYIDYLGLLQQLGVLPAIS